MKRGSILTIVLVVAACATRAADVGYEEPPSDGTVVTCPVSREACTKTPLTPAAVYEMRTYYFCCDDCPRRFAAEPERYVGRK